MTTAVLNRKIGEVENKIPVRNLISTNILSTKIKEVENNVTDLVKKTKLWR